MLIKISSSSLVSKKTTDKFDLAYDDFFKNYEEIKTCILEISFETGGEGKTLKFPSYVLIFLIFYLHQCQFNLIRNKEKNKKTYFYTKHFVQAIRPLPSNVCFWLMLQISYKKMNKMTSKPRRCKAAFTVHHITVRQKIPFWRHHDLTKTFAMMYG